MHSTNGSPISNSRSSTNNNNSTNATKTSPPPALPTANSWPDSTRQAGHAETASRLAPHLLQQIASQHQLLSFTNSENHAATQG
jgi:hypothetical protein